MTTTTYAMAEFLEGPCDGAEWVLEQGETFADTYSEDGALYVRATFPEHAGSLFYVHAPSVAEYVATRRSNGQHPGSYACACPAGYGQPGACASEDSTSRARQTQG